MHILSEVLSKPPLDPLALLPGSDIPFECQVTDIYDLCTGFLLHCYGSQIYRLLTLLNDMIYYNLVECVSNSRVSSDISDGD